MATHSRQRSRRGGAWGVSAIGSGLAVGALAYGLQSVQSTGIQLFYPAVEVLLLLALAGTVAVAGAWLHRSDLPAIECWRVASWVGLGVITLVGLTTWQLLTQVRGGATLHDPLLTLLVTQTVGATLGLLVGIYHVRAVENARAAEDAAAAASDARAAQSQLAFVHSLLRHHLFNGMQVIQSYTTRLAENVDDEGREDLETIQRRSERLVTLVENMQPLARTLTDSDRLHGLDVESTIRDEVEHVEIGPHGATVTVDGPERPVAVQADSLLPTVFENLLRSAIERSAVASPEVDITIRPTGDACEVVVAATGPAVEQGIDRRFLAAARPDTAHDDDIDLHLVRELLDRYDGSLTVAESGPKFVVRLPLADSHRP
jgi:signal transduction histidine kinase